MDQINEEEATTSGEDEPLHLPRKPPLQTQQQQSNPSNYQTLTHLKHSSSQRVLHDERRGHDLSGSRSISAKQHHKEAVQDHSLIDNEFKEELNFFNMTE